MALGIMVSVNQRIDFNTVEKIAVEMGFEAQDVGFKEARSSTRLRCRMAK